MNLCVKCVVNEKHEDKRTPSLSSCSYFNEIFRLKVFIVEIKTFLQLSLLTLRIFHDIMCGRGTGEELKRNWRGIEKDQEGNRRADLLFSKIH